MKPTDAPIAQVKVIATEAACASGLSKNEIFESCLKQKSAVQETGLAPLSETMWAALNTHNSINESHGLTASRYCLEKTLAEANYSASELADCGFIFATTTSQIDQWQNSLPFCHTKHLSFEQITASAKYQSLGITMIQLQNEFGIKGPSNVIASSCSASLQALSLASLWIQIGLVKRCIVGSTEILSDLTVNGFNSMRLLSKGICKPFDKNRNGINLGEASAFLILESATLSDRKSQGFITGFGLTTDAYNATSPHPEGLGSQKAMTMALKQAGLTPYQIDWFHAHGTGSQANDAAESKSIQNLFSDDAYKIAAVSSTKSTHGHTLGACGALESVLALLSLKNNIILPTVNSENIDPAMGVNVILKPTEKKLNHILKNSLGFGGINAAIVLSKSAGGQ